MRKFLLAAFAASLLGVPAQAQTKSPDTLLNVSYDISRELYAAVNEAFIKNWRDKTDQTLTISQSHAGSSRHQRPSRANRNRPLGCGTLESFTAQMRIAQVSSTPSPKS